jgi:hypothetical protein
MDFVRIEKKEIFKKCIPTHLLSQYRESRLLVPNRGRLVVIVR